MARDANNPYSMTFDLDPEKMTVTAALRKRQGEDFVELESEVFAFGDVAEDLQPNVSCYGLSKIISDRASQIAVGPDKLAGMREVMAQLAAGQWAKERVVGAPTVSAEVEALAQMKGISIPDAQRALKKYAPEQREKIFANAKIKELAHSIREARAASTTDVSLDDLAA